jgi:hypothetical protein
MARLRSKSYRESAEGPVTSAPTNGAELPPVAAHKPVEPIAVGNAVKQAEQSALRDRLREMENAEGIAREVLSQQPRLATELPTEPLAIEQEEPQEQPLTVEQIIEGSGLPERAKTWLRAHPDYISDPTKNARIQKMHHVAEYQAGGEYTDTYFERMEHLLGLRQAPNGNGQAPHRPVSVPTTPRNPPRQQSSVPFSAPPTREAPSMSTGRAPTRRAPLTPAQREAARCSGISDQEYAEQLEKYEFQKQQGMHQDGRQ